MFYRIDRFYRFYRLWNTAPVYTLTGLHGLHNSSLCSRLTGKHCDIQWYIDLAFYGSPLAPLSLLSASFHTPCTPWESNRLVRSRQFYATKNKNTKFNEILGTLSVRKLIIIKFTIFTSPTIRTSLVGHTFQIT